MKLKNLYTLGTIIAGTALTSCNGSFLDVTSKTESNLDNFYSTQQDAWRALIGCYDGWRQVSSTPGEGFYVSSTIMSDETFGGSGNSDGYGNQVVDEFDFTLSAGDQSLFNQDWIDYYAGIYRCNMLLQNEGNIDWDSDEIRGQYLGETRALRAIMYFDIARWFGHIPLFLEPSTENRPQNDPAEVYAWILEDLRYAVNNIPEDANHGLSDWGRITKQAAEGILARAYLYYTGYYGKEPGWNDEELGTIGNVTKADVLAGLEDAIASGYYSLVPEFKNLWVPASVVPIPDENGWDPELSTYAGDNNSEVMLAQCFTPTQDYNGNNDSNRWLVNMGLRNYNTNTFGKPYGQGWGFCPVCPTFYNYFAANDPRREASIIDLAAEGLATGTSYENTVRDTREWTGFMVKKYTPMVYGSGNPATNADGTAGFMECNPQQWVIIRYADVLLMAAELGSPNAQSYFDQVRARVGLSPVALTQENIMEERKLEFAMEGIRYWDLMRQANGGDVTALADAIMVANGQKVTSNNTEAYVTYNRDKILKTKGLVQIPQTQITLSDNVLKQNEGWY